MHTDGYYVHEDDDHAAADLAECEMSCAAVEARLSAKASR
jgi:hypothetical protein